MLTAESLVLVRDPLRWPLALGVRGDADTVRARIRVALAGPEAPWTPPAWLLDHQVGAARRIAGALEAFHGALLCDAVGLGKTYVALAVALRYRRPVAIVPAVLREQWRRTARRLAVSVAVISHESLSRGGPVPPGDCYIVDEAHRFRNAATARYDRLARGMRRSPVLLVTATPVVNTPADLAHLIRLFCADHALAPLGIDSLETLRGGAGHRTFARCVLPLVVSRTASGAGLAAGTMPDVWDAPVVAVPTLDPRLESGVIAAIDDLRFPTFGSQSAAELLRLHLLHRLSSSVAACAATVRRHTTYLERAIDAARRGERLSRRDARRLFDPDDDHQLDLAFPPEGPCGPMSTAALIEERDRVYALRDLLTSSRSDDAKLCRLRHLLNGRPPRRTIVFVGSIHTGLELARALCWRNVVTVSGRGARIASGPLPVRDALALFAPRAREAPTPPDRERALVLIATDLVSEGLDLQDADQIVHYDLPWTPLRLQQRLGRVARLGSSHERVAVRWFAPSAALDARLRLHERIAHKEHWQRNLAVAVSSRLGESTVVGWCLRQREALAGPSPERTRTAGRPISPSGPLHALVRGPHAAALALDWRLGSTTVPAVVVLAGLHWRVVQPIDRWLALLEQLLDGPISTEPVPPGIAKGLETYVRRRLGIALTGPRDGETTALARRLVRMARTAANARQADRLPELEGALERLVGGLPVGRLRALREAVRSQAPWRGLRQWLRDTRVVDAGDGPTVVLRAALIGDGTAGS